MLKGDFDFSARLGDNTEINWSLWKDFCLKQGKIPSLIFNAGFMIFKNNLHHKIKREWLDFINEDLPKIHPLTYTKEQLALTLALSGYKIKQMDKFQHAFAWNGETKVDTYVLHGYPRTLSRRFMVKIRRMLST